MSVRSASSGAGSNRSSNRSASSSVAAAAAAASGDAAGSVRSQAAGGSERGSTRSVTSSVAMAQLQQLESVLLKERQAREEAERTLTYLLSEKADKDAAQRRGELAERQLQTLLKQLNRVVDDPRDASKLRTLQRYALQGATSATPSERSAASSAASSQRSSSGTSNNGHQQARASKKVVVASPASGAAAAGAGAGASTAAQAAAEKAAVSFFEKFGRGDARQMQVMERAMAATAGVPAAGTASGGTTSHPVAGNRLHAGHVPAVGSRGTVAELGPKPMFTHRKTDLH